MATQPITKISEEEYLRLERAAEHKSEFVDGEIFAMSGGTTKHSRLSIRWTSILESQLHWPCLVYDSNLKTRTPSTGSYVYPDASVYCGKPQMHKGTIDVATNPRVVIEVLSPSTAAYDRGKKFDLYREIASLQEYVLCFQDSVCVLHYKRHTDGTWIFREYLGANATITLQSIDCTIKLSDVYRNIEFDEQD